MRALPCTMETGVDRSQRPVHGCGSCGASVLAPVLANVVFESFRKTGGGSITPITERLSRSRIHDATLLFRSVLSTGNFAVMIKRRHLISAVGAVLLCLLAYLQMRTWKRFDWHVFWLTTHRVSKVYVGL